MECKLSEENIKLETEIKELRKNVEEYKNNFNTLQKNERIWVDDLEETLKGLGYSSSINVDVSLRLAFDELIALRKETGKGTEDIKDGRCEGSHCRRYYSNDWDFCPYCGRPIGLKEVVKIDDIFSQIEKDLPITIEGNWRVRWSWAKRILKEGKY